MWFSSLRRAGWNCAYALPLRVRKPLALALAGYTPLSKRHWYATRLLEDFARRQPENFQRLIWSHHLGRAAEYERAHGLLSGQLSASRMLLARDLMAVLESRKLSPKRVLDAGCADGHFLRHLELSLSLQNATWLGVDIDARALRAGERRLAAAGSQIRLRRGDLCHMSDWIGEQAFDLVLCAGVLRFFNAEHAAGIVARLLRHTLQLLALSGPAHRQCDNASLKGSEIGADCSYIHNLDAMVEYAGGQVLWRRWQPAGRTDGQSLYFVFAAPGFGN